VLGNVEVANGAGRNGAAARLNTPGFVQQRDAATGLGQVLRSRRASRSAPDYNHVVAILS
jgi:hypothetical protein